MLFAVSADVRRKVQKFLAPCRLPKKAELQVFFFVCCNLCQQNQRIFFNEERTQEINCLEWLERSKPEGGGYERD